MRELLGVILALVLGGLGVALFGPMVQEKADEPVEDQAAPQFEQFADAGDLYVKAYYAALVAATGGGSVAEVTPAMLQATAQLDPSFVDQNAFGQTHRLLVAQPVAGQLRALALTCGPRMPEKDLFRIAPRVGKHGGMISSNDAANAVAADGGWSMPLALFGTPAGCTLEAGALARGFYYDGGTATPPYMARSAVPGLGTEPNTMRTDQYMAGNRLRDAGEVRFQGQAGTDSGLEIHRMAMLNDQYSVQVQGTACTSDSALARTAAGQPLVCRASLWEYSAIEQSSTSACTAARNGVIRWNSASTRGEYCDGAGGSPVWRPFSQSAATASRCGGSGTISASISAASYTACRTTSPSSTLNCGQVAIVDSDTAFCFDPTITAARTDHAGLSDTGAIQQADQFCNDWLDTGTSSTGYFDPNPNAWGPAYWGLHLGVTRWGVYTNFQGHYRWIRCKR